MAYNLEELAPLALGQCGRNEHILSAGAVTAALDNIDSGLALALAASQAEGRAFVFRDRTVYVKDGEILEYGSLAEAILQAPGFAGYAYVAEDIGTVSSFSGQISSALTVSGRLVLDLNGRTVSCDAPTLAALSSNTESELSNGGLPDVTVRNGTVVQAWRPVSDDPVLSAPGRLFVDYHGSLKFENATLRVDCEKTYDQALVRVNGSEDIGFIRKASVQIDKDSELVMENAGAGQAMMMLFSSQFRLKSNSLVNTRERFLDYLSSQLGLTEDDVIPEIFVDGRCSMTAPASGWNMISAQYADDFEPVPERPMLVTGNGGDKGRQRFVVGPHAYLNAGDGIALYSGSTVELKLEGGTIIGGTGIAMRGGTLVVPPAANPLVVGSGPYAEYLPYHTMVLRRNPDDPSDPKSGSDAQTFLNLGHAVLLENNGASGYGYEPVSALIESGTFVSYNNTSFGSYGIGKSSRPPIPAEATAVRNYNGSDKTLYFEKRLSGFVRSCSSNRPPLGLEYDYGYGRFPDWQQTAPGSETRSGCETYKRVPYDESMGELESLIPH